MERIKGGVTAAKGFMAASTAAGIKYQDREDMALIYSETPCQTAGTFTTNVVKAAPVQWDKALVDRGGQSQMVVINSGIANACTGEEGRLDCEKTAKKAAEVSGIDESLVLVNSTGVIGVPLPMDKVESGIECLFSGKSHDLEAGNRAAKAILTTDTKEKEVAVTISIGSRTVTIGAMAKGSGMIHPNMGTMLVFITTDALIEREAMVKALRSDILDTFNMISVDGDTSTNDTVLLLANGQAQNPVIREDTEDYQTFVEALHFVNETLAKKIAGDGEGSTALLEMRVVGAETKEQARIIARSVVSSNLTKTAIAGHDANWGRFLCAMGYSGAEFDPEKVDLWIQSKGDVLQLLENGLAAPFSEEEATGILSDEEITITADLKLGDQEATAWGCDLTHEYININADYRS